VTALRLTIALLSLVALLSCRSDRLNDPTAALAFGGQHFRRPQPHDPERVQMIQKCMKMNRLHNTDPYSARGGWEHMYHACMADEGHHG
jgi:hypothetical protein